MKSTRIILTIAALALALPASLHAAKGAKDPAKKEAKQASKQALAQYDKNANGTIDEGDEAAALTKAFDADKTGPLKPLDLNADGKLESNEVAKIHAGKKGDKGAKKKKKNNA
jgi:hypothetical protein